MINSKKIQIAIIGLGYVGLPLACEFGKKYKTIGFDINSERIKELEKKIDTTLEVTNEQIHDAKNLTFSDSISDIKNANIFIVTVPTPIDKFKKPDLSPLIAASKSIGSILKKDDVVIYESTVFPGATEEVCIPELENASNLKYNQDFFAGYSPERINPGDKEHRVTSILKVTSGSNEKIAKFVDELYGSIITAGTFKAESIRVAEAAKVIENTQRDLNIALMNELSKIFNLLNIDTEEVLKAAGTKWNFLPFSPGLVGGHCIGVDPYYLTHKAESVGYKPEVILAGRRINDGMGSYVASNLLKLMLSKKIQALGSKVLVMGFTFKENCPDIRNTKVIDVINELGSYGISVDIHDPIVDEKEMYKEYKLRTIQKIENNKYDALIIAVAHSKFKDLGIKTIKNYLKKDGVLYDLKSAFPSDESNLRL